MRAVVCQNVGVLEDLKVVEQDDREPGPGEVAIDVKCAGVNFADGLLVQGRYQLKPAPPFTPGCEVAGVVSALGAGVEDLAVGDRVLCMTWLGGYASRVVVPASTALPIPQSLPFGSAAVLVQSYATMMYAFTRRTHLAPGEWVLVLGAGGGIGLAAIDVATALGARVIAAASTDEKLALAREAGAQATIAYEREDLKVRARELSGGGVDVVVDAVGGRQSEPALHALRKFGRFCVIGFASGSIPSLPLNQVMLNNRTIVGVDWGAWMLADEAGNRELVGEILELVRGGRLHPPLPSERPLDAAAEVMAAMLDRRVTGKVVLVP